MSHRHGHGHGHGGGTHLDAADRVEWQRPEQVVAALGLQEGAVVADIGAGTGYFEPLLSRAVGASGRVLALEVDAAQVEQMRARHAALTNVEVRQVRFDDPGLPAIDGVLLVDVWHHLQERVAYARKLRAAAKRVVIVDYERSSAEGPPMELRVGSEAVMAELRAAGFSSVRVLPVALPRQYLVVAE